MRIKNKKSKKVILLPIILLLLAGGTVGYLMINNQLSKPTVTTTDAGKKIVSDPNVPHETKKPTVSGSSGFSTEKDNPNNQQPAAPASNTTPRTPTGTFVSNHRPHLSGTPTPNTESSTCTTTPGATCVITFTKGSTTRTLTSKKADAQGNVLWNWSLQQIGLTEGTWKITAIASNGDLTAKATDEIDLAVAR